MCIEALFIANSDGKLLYYRNYSKDLSQFLIEDFAFSLQSVYLKNNQHIFSTHGSHRLVYLPIDNCLLVLVTDCSSNIVEDVDSISRIKEVVTGLTENKLNEELVYEHYLDLTMAFDEMINLNSRILFNKSQISTLLLLESTNEKIQLKILEEKAQQTQKKNEAEIKHIERLNKVKEMIREEVNEIDKKVKEMAHEIIDNSSTQSSTGERKEIKSSQTQKKGMQLGKQTKQKLAKNEKKNDQISKTEKTENVIQNDEVKLKWNPLNDEVKLLLEEKISGQIDSNGDLKKFDLKGSLNVFIENDELDKLSIQTEKHDAFKYISTRLSPNFDKTAFGTGVISLKSKTSVLPCKTIVETLKYNLTTSITTETAPFKINFWFSGNQFSSEIDFNSSQSLFSNLQNIKINFKKLISYDFEISDCENSQFSTENRYLVWKIPLLDKKTNSATITVNFEESITEANILPAEIEIESDHTIFGIDVKNVLNDQGREVKFSFRRLLSAKDLSIEV